MTFSNNGYTGGVPESRELVYTSILLRYGWIRHRAFYIYIYIYIYIHTYIYIYIYTVYIYIQQSLKVAKQLTALTPIYSMLNRVRNDFKQLAFVVKFIFKPEEKSCKL